MDLYGYQQSFVIYFRLYLMRKNIYIKLSWRAATKNAMAKKYPLPKEIINIYWGRVLVYSLRCCMESIRTKIYFNRKQLDSTHPAENPFYFILEFYDFSLQHTRACDALVEVLYMFGQRVGDFKIYIVPFGLLRQCVCVLFIGLLCADII